MELVLGPAEQEERKASMCAWHLTRSPLFSSRHLRSASTSQAAAAAAGAAGLGCVFSSLPLPPATETDVAAAAAAASMLGLLLGGCTLRRRVDVDREYKSERDGKGRTGGIFFPPPSGTRTQARRWRKASKYAFLRFWDGIGMPRHIVFLF